MNSPIKRSNNMKRASSLFVKPTLFAVAMFSAGQTIASDDPVTACAEKAYQETGETHYRIVDKDSIFPGLDIFRIELNAGTTRVHCKTKNNRVRKITFSENPEIESDIVASR